MNLSCHCILRSGLILFFILFVFSITVFGQEQAKDYEPKIMILSPAKTSVSPDLQKELKSLADTIAKNVAQLKQRAEQDDPALKEQSQNVQLMTQNGKGFLSNLDFFKQVSYLSYNYLVYRFYERFPNELLLLKDTTVAGDLNSLQQLARKEQMPYIINFPVVNLLKDKGRKAEITVQLYELSSNSLLINKIYKGDDRNPGFEFTCDDGTLNCTLNNALSGALSEIIRQIAINNPTLKRERALSEERARALQSGLFQQPFDASLVKQVVPQTDSAINLNKIYQCLYNADQTQFVAFSAETGVNNQFKSLHDKKDKGKIDIITSKDIHNGDYLNSIPKTYAFIIKGVKYKGKWYYEKDKITYFDAASLEEGRLMYLINLAGWDYFKENSTDSSPEFWNGKLFEKVADRKKDPKWERYKNMWETEERENRDYVGLFEIVANQLKEEKKQETDVFKKNISATVLMPFFKEQVKSKLNHIASYDVILNNFVLIYPKDRQVILTPLKVTDEKGAKAIRFFVTVPATKQIYEWTYFKPHALDKGFADNPINEMLGSVTKWTFAYDTLDDTEFWNKYVWAKEGTDYKYLKLLNK